MTHLLAIHSGNMCSGVGVLCVWRQLAVVSGTPLFLWCGSGGNAFSPRLWEFGQIEHLGSDHKVTNSIGLVQ